MKIENKKSIEYRKLQLITLITQLYDNELVGIF